MRIFLSYRREDAAAWAGRLRDALATQFGERNIFQDVVAVRPGEHFSDAIERALSECDVTLVVIGPRWLTVTDTDGRPRLEQSGDHVRSELLAALAHQPTVVPVLVDGAAMPSAGELPEDLRPLAQRQAVTLRDTSWHQDVDHLVRALRGETDRTRRRRWPVVAAVAVATAAIGAIAAWWLIRDDDSDDVDQTASTDASGQMQVTGCPLDESEWNMLPTASGASASLDGPSGAWLVEVARSAAVEDSGSWLVLVAVEATNLASEVAYNDAGFYELVVDGVEYRPYCFDVVAGNNPLEPDSKNEAVVGFAEIRDPNAPLALDVAAGGDQQRIDITPAAG